MKIKAILFDADGVIINGKTTYGDVFVKENNMNISEMLPFYTGIFQECVVGKNDLKEILPEYLKKRNSNENVDDFLEKWFKYEHNVCEKISESIINLKQKGFTCHLATNQEKYRGEYMKDEMGFGGLFDSIFISHEIGYKKPETEYFQHVINDLNLKPEEILFFDDSQQNIDSAKKLGINSYLYESFEGCEEVINKLFK